MHEIPNFQEDDDDKSYHTETSEDKSIDEENNTANDIMKLTTAVLTAGTNGVDSQLNPKHHSEVKNCNHG